MVTDAQRKLDALVAGRIATKALHRAGASLSWLAGSAATSAVVAAVAMLWLPLGSMPALAFAKVQQHFRDFRTLRFDVEQRMNGKVLMKSRVQRDARRQCAHRCRRPHQRDRELFRACG